MVRTVKAQTDGLTNNYKKQGQTDKWTDGQTDGRTDRQMQIQIDRQTQSTAGRCTAGGDAVEDAVAANMHALIRHSPRWKQDGLLSARLQYTSTARQGG